MRKRRLWEVESLVQVMPSIGGGTRNDTRFCLTTGDSGRRGWRNRQRVFNPPHPTCQPEPRFHSTCPTDQPFAQDLFGNGFILQTSSTTKMTTLKTTAHSCGLPHFVTRRTFTFLLPPQEVWGAGSGDCGRG